MRAQQTFIATGLVALLALAGVTAAIAADPAGDPPPKIAFLANGIVPADALAAGSIAGQLGAPVFTTPPDALSDAAAEGLEALAPELVIVLGGPVAISDPVVNEVAAATGLKVEDPDARPEAGIVRAAGENRFETASVVADLLGHYDPAYLGVDLKALDADTLDGMDSNAFRKTADPVDAQTLQGRTPSGLSVQNHTIVESDHQVVETDGFGEAIASCPAGTKVLGGGWSQTDGTEQFYYTRNGPLEDGSGWRVLAHNRGFNNFRVFWAYAICATVTPAS